MERKSGNPIEYPLAYLKQAALSQARRYTDKKFRQGFQVAPEIALENTAAQEAYSTLEKKEEEQKVWDLLANPLNQMEQSVVFKRVVEDYSYKEIAREEGMPNEQYLQTLYHRAKNKLIHYLKNAGYDKPQP